MGKSWKLDGSIQAEMILYHILLPAYFQLIHLKIQFITLPRLELLLKLREEMRVAGNFENGI